MSYSYLLDAENNMRFNVKSNLVSSKTSSTLQHNITSATSNKFITHTVDDYGYHIKNGLTNAKLLSINHSNVLNDCIVKNEISQSVSPLTTTISNHEVRLTAVENGQPAGQPLGISDILNINNDASNKSIVGIDGVTCNTININGITLTNVDGELTTSNVLVSTNALYAPVINSENIGSGGTIHGDTIEGYTSVTTPQLNCNAITCRDNITGTNLTCSGTVSATHVACSGTVFSTNITTLTNAVVTNTTNINTLTANYNRDHGTLTSISASITSLTSYDDKIKRFMNAISQSINLLDPETGLTFDFSGLI